jgi:ankyrin repeat protein
MPDSTEMEANKTRLEAALLNKRSVNVITALIRGGASVHDAAILGTRHDRIDVVKHLLKKNMSKDTLDYSLFVAARHGRVEIARLLLHHGTDGHREWMSWEKEDD